MITHSQSLVTGMLVDLVQARWWWRWNPLVAAVWVLSRTGSGGQDAAPGLPGGIASQNFMLRTLSRLLDGVSCMCLG